MSASKEIKSHLKAAKASLDKQDYQTAVKHCQDIFRADAKHYTALVFAGLASLKLEEYEESRQYYRSAVEIQPEGPLGWKGFGDFYDHHKPVVSEEQLEAINTYTKLLPFIANDVDKVRATYRKLIRLHKEFNHQEEVIGCYDALTLTYDPGELADLDAGSCSEAWAEFIAYVVVREHIPEECWGKLQHGFHRIEDNAKKQALREKLVKKLYARYLASGVCDDELRVFLIEECTVLLAAAPVMALSILIHLLLMEKLPSSLQELIDKPITVTEQQRDWVCQLCAPAPAAGSIGETTPMGCSLGWAGQALVCVADGKWNEAIDAINKSVGYSSVKCECWYFSSLLHLRHHDYKKAEQAAENGLACLSGVAKFEVSALECYLRVCQCLAYIGRENVKLTSQALPYLTKQVDASHESHVTAVLAKAHLLLDDVSSAQSVLDRVDGEDKQAVHLALQGEVYLVQKEFDKALAQADSALQAHPHSPCLLFTRARILWDQDRSKAYSALLQAAKADPMNPDVFLYLGHYQRLITGDLKRAEKCYQKAVTLQPSHANAAVHLGDILWTNGDEDKAYGIYKAVTADALPSKTKVAWIRMGLYQKTNKQYSESIKSFQTILSSFPDDKHCWECLGEAYLARGSHNSALKTFTNCIKLDPDSTQCHYQIACIKQLLGMLQESLVDYSSVLEKEPDFVPALKGKGEAHLKLAHLALEQNFDGTAVDHVSSAIQYLTRGAWLRPRFTCVWKLLGDSCTCLHLLPSSVARPLVPSVLRAGNPGGVTSELELEMVEKKELFEIGCRCYCKALELQPEAGYLWHDVGLCYFHLAQCMPLESDLIEKKQTLEIAFNACKKAVGLDSSCHRHWNTLGVVATCEKDTCNPELAQHCFIRSIEEEKNNVVAWTNLGALYLKHDNTELAFKAFKKAVALTPDFVQAWIGHAFIAERMGSDDIMDLFRHSTELDYHPESSVGYGYWVCHTLQSMSPLHLLNPGGAGLNEVARRGLLQARDNLQKFAGRVTGRACPLNYLGLLCEREGLLIEAHRAFVKALEQSQGETDSNVLAVKLNLARIQSTLGYAQDAAASLMAICQEENSSSVWMELALALFRSNSFTDSKKAYDQAIHLDSSRDSKSAVFTAQAMVAFTQGDSDSCKSLLLEAFQSPPVSLHCLVCLCALACLSNDHTLLLATLQELDKALECQKEDAYVLHESCAQVLRVAQVLLASDAMTPKDCVLSINNVIMKIPDHPQPHMLPPSPLVLRTLLAGDGGSIKSQAQKLMHSYPHNVWAMAALTSQLQTDLRDGYRLKTQHLVECELAECEVHYSPWQQTQKESLTALRSWLHM